MYNQKTLNVLVDLRKAAGLTQTDVALFFEITGKKGRETIGSWESGMNRPQFKRIPRFLIYLLDKLGLRRDPLNLFRLWQQIVVEQWGYPPIEHQQWREIFPYHPYPPSFFPRAEPIFMAPPLPSNPLIGREVVQQKLKTLITGDSRVPVVALYGMPGVGKTSLALAVAHEPEIFQHFPDGVLWAGLGSHANIFATLGRWGVALGLDQNVIDQLTKIEDRAQVVHDIIRSKRLLLILDDVWHAQDALHLEVGGIHCVRLITTRFMDVAVEVANPNLMLVGELDLPQGVTLLTKLVPVVEQVERFRVEDLVRHVGGHPLSLLLIGSFLRGKGFETPTELIQAITGLIEQTERLLEIARTQGVLTRHPSLPLEVPLTVHVCFDISYQSLDAAVRVALINLLVFETKPNSFLQATAHAVLAPQGEDWLQVLVGASLVEQRSPWRYSVHPVVSAFAGRYGSPSKQARLGLILYFVEYLRENNQNYDAVDEEYLNILSAIEWAEEEKCFTELVILVEYFYPFLNTRGFYTTAYDWLLKAEKATQIVNDAKATARIKSVLGAISFKLGNYQEAEYHLTTSLELFTEEPLELEARAKTLLRLSDLDADQGNYARAESYAREGIQIISSISASSTLCELYRSLGKIAWHHGNYSEAKEYLEKGLVIAQAINEKDSISSILGNLGTLADYMSDSDEAFRLHHQALHIAQELGHRERICICLINIGRLFAQRRDYPQAIKQYGQGLEIARSISNRNQIVVLLLNLGDTQLQIGDTESAKDHFEEGLRISREIGHREMQAYFLGNIAELFLKTGNTQDAIQYCEEALSKAAEIEAFYLISGLYEIQARAFLQQNALSSALNSFQESLKVANRINAKDLQVEALRGILRIHLTEKRRDEALKVGQVLLLILEEINLDEAEKLRKIVKDLHENLGGDLPTL